MKRTILFVLAAILFVALFTGCRAYRRTDAVTPGYHATERHNGTARSFHYRNDGYVAGHNATRDSSLTRAPYTYGHHNYRHDGMVTDTDGVIGNGIHADGYNAARRAADGVGRATDNLGEIVGTPRASYAR